MTQKSRRPRGAIALLLAAAAALPLGPLAAQDAPAADPPTLDVPAPEADESEPEPREVTIDPPAAPRARGPAAEDEPEADEAAPPAARAARRAPRTVTRTTAPTTSVAPAAAPVVASSPAPAAPEVTATPPSGAIELPPGADATAPADGAPPPATQPAEPTEESGDGGSAMLWLLAALVAAGVAAFFLLRRRRGRAYAYERAYAQPAHQEPAPLADPVAEPLAAAPLAAAPAAVLGAGAASVKTARPWIELLMRPGRAGVTGEDARVEFELTVDNRGTAPAEDVRIATWMLASGSSDAERMLVAPGHHAETPPMAIAAGESRTVAATVALPTSLVEGDAVLPVVVADARYTLPDGTEERVTMSYAVGVPDGRELAHFAIANPSGLHEGVVARPLGEPARA